jgi:hypothetical protein
MSTQRPRPVEFVPLLTPGKHRRPRKGACFMEFASYLAGERWSDHPACTHPLLASLARQVNDQLSDEWRQRLVHLVPDVIGLTGSDLRIDVLIALRAARTALPVVAEERQRVLAEALVSCDRMLAALDGRAGDPLSPQTRAVLEQAPGAAAWAQRYGRTTPIPKRVFRRQTAPAIVGVAVNGLVQACIADPDELLYDLLAGAIDDCRPYRAAAARSGWTEPRSTEAQLSMDPAPSGADGTQLQ